MRDSAPGVERLGKERLGKERLDKERLDVALRKPTCSPKKDFTKKILSESPLPEACSADANLLILAI